MVVHVLVVSVDAQLRQRLMRVLRTLEEVRPTGDPPDQLWDHLNRGDVDLVLVDAMSLSRQPGAVVGAIRKLPEQPEVVALTNREDANLRSSLLAAGCLAVLFTGLEDSSLRETLSSLVKRRLRELMRQIGADRSQQRASLSDFISESPTMQQFMVLARRVINSDSSLLLLGETGVGKERLANAIHHEGPRNAGPFLCLNCAALPETLLESELFGHEKGAFTGATRTRRGYFEMAHGGTIFLDEIAELPPHLQVKLLRVLEDRSIQRLGGETLLRVDVRLMAATNRDLEAEIAAGRFRTDLYFRLAVVTLWLPPLRERREDIPGLVASYLEHFGPILGGQVRTLKPRALEALVNYDWPGNVRELINVIERSTLLATSDEIDLVDLPPSIAVAAHAGAQAEAVGKAGDTSASTTAHKDAAQSWRGLPLLAARDRVLIDFHRQYLGWLLAENDGRIGDTAKAAGINVRTLYQLMKRYGLRKEDYRRQQAKVHPAST